MNDRRSYHRFDIGRRSQICFRPRYLKLLTMRGEAGQAANLRARCVRFMHLSGWRHKSRAGNEKRRVAAEISV